MANIPYMPLYMGDWLQDMDSVSLECEAAWLRIVFKMFKDDKSGVYKNNAKGLQRLWKCDANAMQNILDELKLEGIGIIEEENGLYVFKNRRMLKDQAISDKRKKAADKRWKKEQFECKTDAKDIQTPENEIEYENESDNKIDFETNLKGLRIHDDSHWSRLWELEEWKDKAMQLHRINEEKLSVYFEEFKLIKQSSASVVDRIQSRDILSHFNNWVRSKGKSSGNDSINLEEI